MSTTPAGGRYLDGQWHRLHPATPLLRGGIATVAILLWLAANLRERLLGWLFRVPDVGDDPIDEIGRHHLGLIAVLVVLGALLIGVGLFWIAWRASSFRIDRDAVTVKHGVLLRTTRTAKLDRIQGVTIQRPLVARLVGAARVELDVAGQNADVRLEYLTNADAEQLRHDVLALASGKREEEGLEPADGVAIETGPALLTITPGRAIGAVLLSETVVVLVVAIAVLLPLSQVFGLGPALAVSVFPMAIASITVAVRGIGRNLRYTILSTPDGVRIASGVVSTSSEAVPPGRVHAVRIEQPLMWRPTGWWRVAVNRAGGTHGRGRAEAIKLLAPVATRAEVLTLLPYLVPDLADRQELLIAGLTGRGGDEHFAPAPRRARWLRPVAWKRTGFRLTDATILLRGGFLKRELVVVPAARVQSVALHQGPFERRLDVASIEPHVVSGPVRTRLGLIDGDRATLLFHELADAGARARTLDVSHRWAEVQAQAQTPVTP